MLGLPVRDLLRKQDKAYKELGLKGEENEKVLVGHIASHPGLLQRPIAVKGQKAIVARPPELVLEI
jgi:arsenate reductase